MAVAVTMIVPAAVVVVVMVVRISTRPGVRDLGVILLPQGVLLRRFYCRFPPFRHTIEERMKLLW